MPSLIERLLPDYDEALDLDGFSGSRLASRLATIAEIGLTDDNGSCRPGYSLAEKKAKDLVCGWMREAGLSVRRDAAGNCFGRLAGKSDHLPAVLCGSHIDTVPNGGHFDGGLSPDPSDIPATMQVDYVRVYEENGGGGNPGNVAVTGVSLNQSTAQLQVGQNVQLNATVAPSNATNKQVTWTVSNSGVASVSQSGVVTGVSPGTATVTATTADGNKTAVCNVTVVSTTIVIGDSVRGLKKTGDNLLFYVNGATFADLHYKVNNGVQLNVAMTTTGNGNFTYPVNNLQAGDTVEYFFTYNPGQGALDTPWQTYVHGVTQGTPE